MRRTLRFFLLLAAGGLCSCAYPSAYRPAWLNQFSTPQHRYYTYRRRRSEHSRLARVRSHRQSIDTVKITEPAAITEGAIAAPPAPPDSRPQVTLTLAGDNEDRERAQNLLQKTDAKLIEAGRRPLSDAQKENYERATQLAGRARRALANNDYTAASSLAGKAWALSADMNRK